MAPRLYNRELLIDEPYLLGLGVEDDHHGGDHGDLVVHVHQGLQTACAQWWQKPAVSVRTDSFIRLR